MTPAASVSFFRPEFNEFLYAPIDADGNEMPLSVLSALSRLDVDPWKEAAELAELPNDTATLRLAALIARLPDGRWAQAESRAIAVRLIELLPRGGSSKVPLTAHGIRGMNGFAVAKMLIIVALAVAALIIVGGREMSWRGDHPDVPAFNRSSPPQNSQ